MMDTKRDIASTGGRTLVERALSNNIMALFTITAIVILAYVSIATVYNLCFHPLARVPGPFLARISTLPSFYHACKGDRHVWIWQNFQLYGDTFRATPNNVLFNSTRAFSDIHSARANVTRDRFYRTWRRGKEDVNTVNSIDKATHAMKRKNLNLAFTEQSTKAAGTIIAPHVDRWVELLTEGTNKTWSAPRNMAPWMSFLVFDILGDLCFGENWKLKEPDETLLKELPHLIMKRIRVGYCISKSGLLDLFIFLQTRGLGALLERARHEQDRKYASLVEKSVDRRIEAHRAGKPVERQDIFQFLLTATDPETNQPAYTNRDHMLAEARLMVVNGTDTTASTLCGLFFYLAHRPRVLQKLTTEIRSTFASMEEIAYGQQLSKCKYLRACLDEALRLAHPAPGDLPREVLPGGATIDGQFYPAGTVVGCSAWAMGRDEAVYGDATIFRPERWIPSSNPDTFNSEEQVRELKKNFQPFSKGPFDCVGRSIALLEMSLVVARTLWKADLRLAPGTTVGAGRPELGWGQRSRDQYILKDSFLCFKDGPELQFRSRIEA